MYSLLDTENSLSLVDKTPPIVGQVFDGPLQGQDLQYTKDYQTVSTNVLSFTSDHRSF
jgi:hypothetical protein